MTINFEDSVKQEIWATVRAMNDAWTKGNPDDLAKFFHRDMVAITATDRNRLDGGAACIAGWKGFATAARIHRWEEVDPIPGLTWRSSGTRQKRRAPQLYVRL
ncbi:MAG: nuclear transport factor 2 family protein [Gammaproteobacteria bacterium]|nr:nuclear transport factor 2 family protein [Gammaproteobacteria bacterium]